MKLSGFFAFTLLSISIMSFGLTGAVNAQGIPLSVSTESSTYTTGNSIEISGSIQNLVEYEQPVVLMIVSPDGNIVTIQQISPDSSGNYSATVKAGGTMNSSGEYEIRAQYGAQKITSTFSFISGDAPDKPTPEPSCNSNTRTSCTNTRTSCRTNTRTSCRTNTRTSCTNTRHQLQPVVQQVVNCGPGTESVNGVCQVIQTTTQES